MAGLRALGTGSDRLRMAVAMALVAGRWCVVGKLRAMR